MTSLADTLDERKDEFNTHFELARAFEDRVLEGGASLGSIALSARHIMTLKSGLVIHLYNIVESTMTQTMNYFGTRVISVSPDLWTDHTLQEWLRGNVPINIEGNEDSRIERMLGASKKLLRDDVSLGERYFKKPSGTWSDKLIKSFADRLEVEFNLPADMWIKIAPRSEYGDKSPMEFLAKRRNAIAHGRRTFEDGAKDLTLNQIGEIADVTLKYMDLAIHAFQQHLDAESYKMVVP